MRVSSETSCVKDSGQNSVFPFHFQSFSIQDRDNEQSRTGTCLVGWNDREPVDYYTICSSRTSSVGCLYVGMIMTIMYNVTRRRTDLYPWS